MELVVNEATCMATGEPVRNCRCEAHRAAADVLPLPGEPRRNWLLANVETDLDPDGPLLLPETAVTANRGCFDPDPDGPLLPLPIIPW